LDETVAFYETTEVQKSHLKKKREQLHQQDLLFGEKGRFWGFYGKREESLCRLGLPFWREEELSLVGGVMTWLDTRLLIGPTLEREKSSESQLRDGDFLGGFFFPVCSECVL